MTEKEPRINPDNAVDATVLEEEQARPLVDGPMPHEHLALGILFVILAGAVFALGQNAAALAKPQHDPALAMLRTPVIVQLPEASAISLAPARREGTQLKSFAGVVNQAQTIRNQAAGLAVGFDDNVIPPVGSRLTPETYALMLEYLAAKEGITQEPDARDVLLRAGYSLPPGTLAENKNNSNHVAFARDVVSALVKDEVESFLNKLNVVSKVGVYVAEQKAPE